MDKTVKSNYLDEGVFSVGSPYAYFRPRDPNVSSIYVGNPNAALSSFIELGTGFTLGEFLESWRFTPKSSEKAELKHSVRWFNWRVISLESIANFTAAELFNVSVLLTACHDAKRAMESADGFRVSDSFSQLNNKELVEKYDFNSDCIISRSIIEENMDEVLELTLKVYDFQGLNPNMMRLITYFTYYLYATVSFRCAEDFLSFFENNKEDKKLHHHKSLLDIVDHLIKDDNMVPLELWANIYEFEEHGES